MTVVKVRKTLTLDPDLVDAFGGDGSALSATINTVLRTVKDRMDRQQAFGAYVDELVETFGEPDEEVRATVADLFDQAEASAPGLLGAAATPVEPHPELSAALRTIAEIPDLGAALGAALGPGSHSLELAAALATIRDEVERQAQNASQHRSTTR